MSSYYKTINGKHYDKAMLDIADDSVNKKKDGRISIADAKKIVNRASDAGKITEIEAETLNYIYEHYKFTKAAEDFFSDFAFLEKADSSTQKPQESEPDIDIFGFKEFLAKYYLLIIVIALIIFLLYLYSGRLISLFQATSTKVEPLKTEQTMTKPLPIETEEKKVKADENEYIVQEHDTLIGISTKLFGDPGKWQNLYQKNRDIIKKPSVIYPGQVLKTDIK